LYQVTIPPNATATLRLNLKMGQKLVQNNQKMPVSKDNTYQLSLISGKYVFEIE
jgi:hypothetical protein